MSQQPIKELKSLIEEAYFKSAQVATYLDMSDRTFRRKMEDAAFDRLESERIERIAELISLGVETFGSKDAFMVWMQSTPETFGGAQPLELLTSQHGIHWIEETLYAIQHGLPE